MAYTIKSGSMPFPQSIKDLAEYLSVNCNSTLEVYYTQGKDANAYAKEMFNEYKTSQKYKSTYKSTIPMDMIIRDLESKEKTNGNKPLTVGSDLYKAFIDQTTKTMRQYVEYFPKVHQNAVLEITPNSCKDFTKFKSLIDTLSRMGLVKKSHMDSYFIKDVKSHYLLVNDNIDRVLRDIQAKEVKTPVVAKPTTTTTTTTSNFVPNVIKNKLDSTDRDVYNTFISILEPFLKDLSIKYQSDITITDLQRTKEEQAYLMLGAMKPDRSKYDGDRGSLTQGNYITIYDASIIKNIIKYGFKIFSSQLAEFTEYRDYFINILFDNKNSKAKTSDHWKTKEGEKAQEFFTTLAHTIIGTKPLKRKELEYNKTSRTFQEFADWVYINTNLDHLGKDINQTAVDFTIDALTQKYKDRDSELKQALRKVAQEIKGKIPQLVKDPIPESKHIHIVVRR